MYKIMVVDDEPNIADGLEELFLKIEQPAFDVYKAYSARAALELLDRIRMDIVVSDIKMPKMNGIEMLAQIKRRWPYCHVVFLSGYSDFEYVQSALNMGADSYLLKSQSDDIIVETILQSVQMIDAETEAEHWKLRMEKELESARPLLRKDFMQKFLQGTKQLSTDELQAEMDALDLPLDAAEPVFLVGGRIDRVLLQSEDAAPSAQLAAQIDAMFAEYMSPKIESAFLHLNQRYLFWLVQPKAEFANDTDFLGRFIMGTMERIQICCEQRLRTSVSVVVDPELLQWEDLPAAFDRLKAIVTFQLGSEDEMWLGDVNFFHSELEPAAEKREESIDTVFEAMASALEYGKREEFNKAMEGALEKIADYSDPMGQIGCYHRLCSLLLERIEHAGRKRAFQRQFGSMAIFALPYEQWQPNMIEAFRNVAQWLFDGSDDDRTQRVNQMIYTLHRYIASHLSENLTIAALAEQVFLNPVYLSRAYRQITGKKLSEYVLECRIKEAKQLLQNRELRVSEIAYSVGFESPAHFSRVFKKMSGITPQEYRDNI